MGTHTAQLNEYRGMLRISKHTLDDDLEVQPVVMERIGDMLVGLNTEVLERADALKRVESRVFADAKANGESDKLADMTARRSAERTEAWNRLQDARTEHERWQALQDAWKSRGYAIKELVSLHSANYFVVGPNNIGSRRPPPARVDYSVTRRVGDVSTTTTRREYPARDEQVTVGTEATLDQITRGLSRERRRAQP